MIADVNPLKIATLATTSRLAATGARSATENSSAVLNAEMIHATLSQARLCEAATRAAAVTRSVPLRTPIVTLLTPAPGALMTTRKSRLPWLIPCATAEFTARSFGIKTGWRGARGAIGTTGSVGIGSTVDADGVPVRLDTLLRSSLGMPSGVEKVVAAGASERLGTAWQR